MLELLEERDHKWLLISVYDDRMRDIAQKDLDNLKNQFPEKNYKIEMVKESE